MKKQLLTIGGGFASFWSAVSSMRQSLEMLAINLVTEKNSKMSNFLTPINNKLARKDAYSFSDQFNNNLMRKDTSLPLEEIHTSLTPNMNWIDEDTSQGGEFLDDALRIMDQPR